MCNEYFPSCPHLCIHAVVLEFDSLVVASEFVAGTPLPSSNQPGIHRHLTLYEGSLLLCHGTQMRQGVIGDQGGSPVTGFLICRGVEDQRCSQLAKVCQVSHDA